MKKITEDEIIEELRKHVNPEKPGSLTMETIKFLINKSVELQSEIVDNENRIETLEKALKESSVITPHEADIVHEAQMKQTIELLKDIESNKK